MLHDDLSQVQAIPVAESFAKRAVVYVLIVVHEKHNLIALFSPFLDYGGKMSAK
jgi:hypothetical protein